jgi:hypothetical protein
MLYTFAYPVAAHNGSVISFCSSADPERSKRGSVHTLYMKGHANKSLLA